VLEGCWDPRYEVFESGDGAEVDWTPVATDAPGGGGVEICVTGDAPRGVAPWAAVGVPAGLGRGGEVVAAERSDRHRGFSESGECPVEMGRGFGPIGDGAARAGQSEREQGAVGGHCAGGHLVEPLDASLGGFECQLGMSQCGGQGVLGGGVGAFEPGDLFQLKCRIFGV
jgi:hypothetical protein